MKADISRDTFQAVRGIRRVIAQQGRPWLDADWNEQMAVLLHRLETMAADVFGEYAAIEDGFRVENAGAEKFAFALARGRYYLHGLMCENDDPPAVLRNQSDLGTKSYFVYLHAWEQYESAVEDSSTAEPALQGLETCGRTSVRWSVELEEKKAEFPDWNTFRGSRGLEAPAAKLRLRAGDSAGLHPHASERVAENVLYRVEVHDVTKGGTARFKWARNNASALTPASRDGSVLKCHRTGDFDAAFQRHGWVEIEAPRDAGREHQEPLREIYQIASVNRELRTIELVVDKAKDAYAASPRERTSSTGETVFARPWTGVAFVKEAAKDPATPVFQPLDAGLEISFDRGGRQLRPAQHWLIAVRTGGGGQVYWPRKHAKREVATNPIQFEWGPLDQKIDDRYGVAPQEPDLSTHKSAFKDQGSPAYRRRHYYGPLAVIRFDQDGTFHRVEDLRNSRPRPSPGEDS